ncbi:MAG TPA: hypothetical protein VFN41_13370, partial [Candidatus Limnocylindrales bacterium]|nr:hypothetical protein [Candidatus Limnocylindrales bacterium]
TAERGTRVLHLLDELESGKAEPASELPAGETLPTPVPRVGHEGDAVDEPPSAVIPPKPRQRHGRDRSSNKPGSRRSTR